MPSPKNGIEGMAVEPIDPEKSVNADVSDPGKIAQAKKAQVNEKKGKYGSEPVKPHKPGRIADNDDKNKKASWIEIKLLDEEDQVVSGEKYEIELPDGSVASGTLDQRGYARVDGIDPGTCKVTFPKLDKDAWEKA